MELEELSQRLDRVERRLESQRRRNILLGAGLAGITAAALIPGVGAVLAVSLWAAGISLCVVAFIGGVMRLLDRIDRAVPGDEDRRGPPR